MLILSSGAHSFLGGKQMATDLANAGTPPALAQGLMVAWQFGGAAMLGFGLVALLLLRDRHRGRPGSLLPVLFLGIIYFAFGLWALFSTGFNPFYMVFLVPGALLIAASAGRKTN